MTAKPPPGPLLAAPPRPPAGRGMLSLSRQRPPPSAGALARRRFMVRLGKFLLPATALGLLAAVVLWPELERTEERARVSFRRTLQPRPEALRVVSPRYQGVDDLNRPFTVTARVAEQPGAENVLDLTLPRADITMTDGSWIYVESDAGRYDRDGNRLTLRGDVTIFHDNGTLFRTQEAAVELNAGAASGDTPVAAQGSFGTLTAEGFRLTERGAVVVFTGHARAILEGSR